MALYVASLNSGSNGNCYYVGNDNEGVLIDVGISCREVEKRLQRLNIPISRIKAAFISHEHGDHIHGVTAFSKKHNLPVYITAQTRRMGNLSLRDDLTLSFEAYKPISIGALTVTGFPKHHDAGDPHSFIVANETVTIGVFTDIGIPCQHVINHFAQCHAAFLESNYDEGMLERGSYPIHLKNRIRNGKGHLSNRQAVKLFVDHRPPFMTHLFLSHLSRNNNRPEIVEDMFHLVAGITEMVVASRDKETPLYVIENPLGLKSQRVLPPVSYSIQQLSLFDH
jgi:phosphoribosyl 1,2-cyclic phosphodiesterase